MKMRFKGSGPVFLIVTGMMLLSSPQVGAESLYEQYAGKGVAQLEQETASMGRQLTDMFSQESIARRQQQIDFAEYYSNLKKVLLYGTRLANYADYERDLQFARDHEVFQGLPEAPQDTEPQDQVSARKVFTGKKFSSMKKNVEEEIETYADLMLLSLEACEGLVRNDLSGLQDNRNHLERVRDLQQTPMYRNYCAKRGKLVRGWPDLARRIDSQLAIWGPKAASPGDALIDRAITGAL